MDTDDPVSFDDAMSRPDSDSWLEAMKAEVQSMYDNQVWDLVDLPPGFRTIENPFVFNRPKARRKINQVPNLIVIHRLNLGFHGFQP